MTKENALRKIRQIVKGSVTDQTGGPTGGSGDYEPKNLCNMY